MEKISEYLTTLIINCRKQLMSLLDCKIFLMKSNHLIRNSTVVVNFCMILSENESFPLAVDKQGWILEWEITLLMLVTEAANTSLLCYLLFILFKVSESLEQHKMGLYPGVEGPFLRISRRKLCTCMAILNPSSKTGN